MPPNVCRRSHSSTLSITVSVRPAAIASDTTAPRRTPPARSPCAPPSTAPLCRCRISAHAPRDGPGPKLAASARQCRRARGVCGAACGICWAWRRGAAPRVCSWSLRRACVLVLPRAVRARLARRPGTGARGRTGSEGRGAGRGREAGRQGRAREAEDRDEQGPRPLPMQRLPCHEHDGFHTVHEQISVSVGHGPSRFGGP